MSVDTRTKGRNLDPYKVRRIDGLQVLVAPQFERYCEAVALSTRRGVLGPRLTMATEHRHGPACRH